MSGALTCIRLVDTTCGNDIAELTSRELDVLTLIGKGLSNTEIADDSLRLRQRYRRPTLTVRSMGDRLDQR